MALATLLVPASAATLLVPDNYPTINDALSAAAPGDVIELTQNSTPYVGNLYITIDDLTIQGSPALNPAPEIIGQSAPHPRAGEGPQPWYWQPGDPSSSNPVVDTHGAAIINDADGLILRNLQIKADPLAAAPGSNTAGAVDFRFGTNGLVENCFISGAGTGMGSERPVLTANDHTFDNVTFEGGVMALEHKGGGDLTITNSTIRVGQHLLFHNGGGLYISNTTLDTTNNINANYGCVIGNQYGPATAAFDNCVFRKSTGNMLNSAFTQLRHHDRGSSNGIDDFNSGRYSPHPLEVTYNQCDFIGGPANQINRVVFLATGRVGWVVKTLRFTGCNFYNIHGPVFNTMDFNYPGNQYMADAGPVDRFEDYNVYKLAQNNAPVAGLASGGNSITLNQGEPLYVDPAAPEVTLAANSPAATLEPAPGQSSTGAVAVSTTEIPVNRITVGHSGADYSSIADALAAATEGALIEIIDDSAPYAESIIFPAVSNGITLQGLPTLASLPVLEPPAGSEYGIRLAGGTSRNHTIRNLFLDGDLGVDTGEKMVLDLRDAGETLVQNVQVSADEDVNWGIFSQASRMLENVNVNFRGFMRAVQQNLSGVVFLQNLNVDSTGEAMRLEGGMFLMKDSFVNSSANVVVLGFDARSSYLDASHTIFSTDATDENSIITAVHVPAGRRTIVLDNCDLVGSAAEIAPGESSTVTGIRIMTADPAVNPLTYMRITDTIFHRISLHAIDFNGNTGAVTIPGLTYDPTVDGVGDYNVYHQAPHTLDSQGVPGEVNRLELAESVPLYINTAAADYHLVETSPAATFNSTGEPAYAGALGPQPSSAVADWAIY